mgnify:CR=1 FL=1
MYRFTVVTLKKGAKKGIEKVFTVDEAAGSIKHQMNEIADYLYDLDFSFDVDEDGDQLIDDILGTIAEGESFEETVKEKGTTYIFRGEVQ